jgi:hypothetical protein
MPKKPPIRPVPTRPAGKGRTRIHVDFSKIKEKARTRAKRFREDDEEAELAPPPPVRPSRRGSVYESRPSNPGGVFLPDHEQLIRLIAARGMSDDEIELIYGLGKGTLARWKKAYPGLQRAIEEGRTVADSNVLFALYKTATGYNYQEEQAVGGRDPQVLQVTKHKAGEFAAQKHWLGNRIRRQDGSNEWPRSEQVELTGANGGKLGVAVETRNDLISAIIGLVTAKPDNERTRKSSEESGKK